MPSTDKQKLARASARWRKANPEKYKTAYKKYAEKHREALAEKRKTEAYKNVRRAAAMLRKYGIGLEEWNGLLERQGGVCAVCLLPPQRGEQLCVDHCHNTGKVRGLLHKKCNTAIGLLNDDERIVRQAANYLYNSLGE